MSHNSQDTTEGMGQNHMPYGRNCNQLVLLGTKREIEGEAEVRAGNEQGQVYSVFRCYFGPCAVLGTEDIMKFRIQRGLTTMFRSLEFSHQDNGEPCWF